MENICFKLEEGRISLDTREKFFCVSMVGHCKMLPREIVDALLLEMFKTRLDVALSRLIYY